MFRRLFLSILVGVMVLGSSHCAWATEKSLPARFTGTFLQLWQQHGTWGEEEWRSLFENFRELGLSRVIIQWSLYEGHAFYPSETYDVVPGPVLETILRLADERGMKVLVGLAHEESFWRSIESKPDLLEVYLQSLKVHSLATAREVLEIVQEHPCFEGWYVPQEIDDVHWLAPERQRVLFDHLGSLGRQLREETPEALLAISGFSNAHADPEALARFWAQLVCAAGIDVVLFQDGIGVEKLDLRHLPLYLEAIRRAVEREDRDFWVVVENFRQVEGPPIDDKPFKAVPASMERLSQQLEIAARFSSGELIAFSVPEYMTPLGGKEAELLFRQYRQGLKK